MIPVLLMIAYSFVTGRSIYFARYLTFAQLIWLATFAFWTSRLAWPVQVAALVGLGSLWASCGYSVAWRIVGSDSNPGMRGAIEHLLSTRNPDEPLLAQRTITLIKAAYYLDRRATPGLLLQRFRRGISEDSKAHESPKRRSHLV